MTHMAHGSGVIRLCVTQEAVYVLSVLNVSRSVGDLRGCVTFQWEMSGGGERETEVCTATSGSAADSLESVCLE